jgi:hypothetical protein
MRHWTITVLLILSVSITQAAHADDSTFDRLAKIDRFAFGGTGYAGTISEGEKEYREILSRPTALKDFERLYAVGNPQAKCYAVVGIRTLNPTRFERLSKSLRSEKTEVTTQRGCMVMHEPLGSIVKGIAAGEYVPMPIPK